MGTRFHQWHNAIAWKWKQIKDCALRANSESSFYATLNYICMPTTDLNYLKDIIILMQNIKHYKHLFLFTHRKYIVI